MIDDVTRDFIQRHSTCDTRTLALQAARFPGVDMRVAITQIEGRQAAVNKLPQWAATEGIIYPPRISMEQCSSEATALYKASLVAGNTLADLTGGFGIDCSYMARRFAKVTYIERNELLCDIARQNFALLGLHHIDIMNGDSEAVLALLPPQDCIFLDPARRAGDGRKVVALCDCEPCVTTMEELLLQKSPCVVVKCSPMLDITAACRELSHVAQVHVVAANNECKELLFVLQRDKLPSIAVHCVNITAAGNEHFSFAIADEHAADAHYSDAICDYLYEPNAAIQKSGCHKLLAHATGTTMLHPNSRLYTSAAYVPTFPGRKFKVVKVYGFAKSDIKALSSLGKANITVRNFPDSVQVLRSRLKLSDGGDDYIFATTLAGGSRVLVHCRKA